MKPLTDHCKHVALFFDESGHFVGKQNVDWKKQTVNFAGRSFNFMPNESTFFKLRYLFYSVKYYMYNLNDPMPILLDAKRAPLLDSTAYNNILETDLLKKLNEVNKLKILDLISNPRVIILLIVAIGIIWYFSTGGTIG